MPDTPARTYPLLLHLLNLLDRAQLPYAVKARPASVRVDVRLPGGDGR
jgi:hypothetical protein